MMSRIAQCFTQARECGILLERKEYSETFDFTGGCDSNGKVYTFSDGCGIISPDYCRKIVEDLKLGDCLPSCYQIRFRGYKGIVTVNKLFEIVKEWAERNGKINGPGKDGTLPWYQQSIIFRESQNKFQAPPSKHLEIVKISSPISVSMNKPMINILDQVSEMHGQDAHKRMCNRIYDLLEEHVDSAISSLYEETAASLTLNEFPKYIPYHRLKDFYLTEEPFLRSLLRASALVSLRKNLFFFNKIVYIYVF
uniref:RNA-dependent RNA polymerase n=1 Tax=Panagrolaimus superbus TaxID=310955 RepID=A0A914YDH3_9BILA